MKVYILMLCDEWKTSNSMKISGIFSKELKLLEAIESLAIENIIDFDWISNTMSISELNAHLKFAFVKTTDLNDYDPTGGYI